MCGICGLMLPPNAPVPLDALNAMNAVQAHRGPDDSGVWAAGSAGLGNRRLAILDLSPAGHMPMTTEDGAVAITFNGEIYNYSELRAALESRGHRFRSHSDTEVVLRLYLEEGAECVRRFRGMFAFGLYDHRKRELLLARDPFGIKPLVYAELPEAFIFGSELKSLLAFPSFPRALDWTALTLYLQLNFVPAPRTIWRAARRLPPGHLLRIRDGKVAECRRYFVLSPGPPEANERDALSALRATLLESVRAHLLSDVPVGVFLSGGMDSSLIAALAKEAATKPLQAFTVTFPGFSTYDEAPYARRVASHLGIPHQEIPVAVSDVTGALNEVLSNLEEPFADQSLVPSAVLSRAARGHVKVALSGDGGDEFFGGYNRYQGVHYAARLKPVRSVVRALAMAPLPEQRTSSFGNRWRRFRRFASMVGMGHLDALMEAMLVFRPDELPTVLEAPNKDSHEALRELLLPLFEEGRDQGLGGMDQVFYTDVHFVLPYDMLHKVDTASMRYSLEVRVPLVDPKVASAAFALPSSMKLRGVHRKWALRQVAASYLPSPVLSRPKGGFDVPLAAWAREGLLPELRETLLAAGSDSLVQPRVARALLDEHLSGRGDCFGQLWNLYVLERWRDRWNPTK